MRSELDRGLREEYVWHGAGTREGEGSGRVQGPGRMQEPGDSSIGAWIWQGTESREVQDTAKHWLGRCRSLGGCKYLGMGG